MIIKPIHDFKKTRKNLSVEQQIHLDNLIISISNVVPHLLELQVTEHTIEFTLNLGQKVSFLVNSTKKILYVMFM